MEHDRSYHDDEDFPGYRRSLDLLRRASSGPSLGTPEDDGRSQMTRSVENPGNLFQQPEYQRSSAEGAKDKVSHEGAQWPNGPPPKAPKSFGATVSPPTRRSSLQWVRDRRPSLRRKGDSWRPENDYQNPFEPTTSFDAQREFISHGERWAAIRSKRPASRERSYLRDTFRPMADQIDGPSERRSDNSVSRRSSRFDTLSGVEPRRNPSTMPSLTVPHETTPSASAGSEIVDRHGSSGIDDNSVHNPFQIRRNGRQTLSGYQFASSNKSGAYEDDLSLRSDGTASSGLAFSARSSATSKAQTTRCYACKDSRISSEQADRAESFEVYVTCVRCLRRYHARCARGHERDQPWTCSRCLTKRSKKSGGQPQPEALQISSSLTQGDGNPRHYAAQTRTPARNFLKEARLSGSPTVHSSETTSVGSGAHHSVTSDVHAVPQMHNAGSKQFEKGTIVPLQETNGLPGGARCTKVSLPQHVDDHGAQGHDRQRSPQPPSVPLRKRVEPAAYVPDTTNHNANVQQNLGVTEEDHDGCPPSAGATAGLQGYTESHQRNASATAPMQGKMVEPVMGNQLSSPGGITSAATNLVPHIQPLPINALGKAIHSHRSSSREQSYSPPPIINSVNASSPTKSMSRKCIDCGKIIFSTTELCTKCQIAKQPSQQSLLRLEPRSAIAVPSSLETAFASTIEMPEDLTPVTAIISDANGRSASSPSKVRKAAPDSGSNEHIFRKRQKLEYRAAKDPTRRQTAKKSASNVPRSSDQRANTENSSATNNVTQTGPVLQTSRESDDDFTNVSNGYPPSTSDNVVHIDHVPPPSAARGQAKTSDLSAHVRNNMDYIVEYPFNEEEYPDSTMNEESIQMQNADDLARKLGKARKDAKKSRRIAKSEREAREAEYKARDAEYKAKTEALEEEIAKLRIQRREEHSELELLRAERLSRGSTDKDVQFTSALQPPSSIEESQQPSQVNVFVDKEATEADHLRVLKIRGVIVESDSELEDESTAIPSPQSKRPPRDPLWCPPTQSKDLFEIAPEYLQENHVSRAFFEAKKKEIARRPRRKDMAGKVLGLNKSERGFDPHREVCKRRGAQEMTLILLEDHSGDPTDEYEGTPQMVEKQASFQTLLHMPADPVPFLMDGQLALKDSTRQGKRAKSTWFVGA